MNFSMRNFIKSGFLNAVGKMGDYWIILNAAGWFDKGVLLETDLVEIQAAIDAHSVDTTASSDAEPAPETPAPSGDAEAGDDTPSGNAEAAPETPA